MFLRSLNKSGGIQETVLWENSLETSVAATTVTLNDSVRNYQYVKIKYRFNTNNAVYSEVWMPVSDFVNTAYATNYNFMFGIYAYYGGYIRRWCAYVSDTSIRFSAGTLDSSTNNNYLIPVQIYGVNIS